MDPGSGPGSLELDVFGVIIKVDLVPNCSACCLVLPFIDCEALIGHPGTDLLTAAAALRGMAQTSYKHTCASQPTTTTDHACSAAYGLQ